MMDGDIEDELPQREAEEAEEQEAPPELPYDPLTDPWNDPASDWMLGRQPFQFEEEAWPVHQAETPSAGPLQAPGPYVYRPPTGRPYPDYGYPSDNELTELRRRLREETVVVPRKHRVWSVTIRELAETLLLAVLIFLAVRASMQNFRVEGASMEPSLDNGEYLIVNKLAYSELDLGIFDWLPFFDSGDDPVHHLWASPGRGDVIVFRAPTNLNRDFIKRIIGVPGDTIQIDPSAGTVILNGEVLQEDYIQGKTTCQSACGPWVVPERAFFVMGDNRQNSSDSRQGWFVPEENIIGKALITYWRNGGPELDLAPNHKVSFTSEASAQE